MVKLLKSNKFWIILLSVVLLASIVTVLLLSRVPATTASIYINGELIERLDLSTVPEPYSVTVNNGYGVNVISVERGRICISEANCPDGSCVRQGWISSGIVPIVCLPHRLVIQFDSDASPDVDAIVG